MATSPKIPTFDAQSISAAQAALAGGQSSADAPGVDKIRELLFGNQMQDYDKRFSLLDDRFQQKLRDIEAESARSVASLEASIKKQLESIAGQVRQEQDLRAEADKELGRGLREQIQALDKRLGQVSDQLASLDTFEIAKSIQSRVTAEVGAVPFLLLLNKADLQENWELSREPVETLEAAGWTVLRTSAKTGEEVEEAFLQLATRMVS